MQGVCASGGLVQDLMISYGSLLVVRQHQLLAPHNTLCTCAGPSGARQLPRWTQPSLKTSWAYRPSKHTSTHSPSHQGPRPRSTLQETRHQTQENHNPTAQQHCPETSWALAFLTSRTMQASGHLNPCPTVSGATPSPLSTSPPPEIWHQLWDPLAL